MMQANVNPALPPKDWDLGALSDKMKQYCYLLGDLTPEVLTQEASGDYEALRDYLRQRAVDAYWDKVLTDAQTAHPCHHVSVCSPLQSSEAHCRDLTGCLQRSADG